MNASMTRPVGMTDAEREEMHRRLAETDRTIPGGVSAMAEASTESGRDDVPTCVFCEICAGHAPATVVHEWDDALAIVPLGPVVDGHILVIPKTHVADFAEDPGVTAMTMGRAAELAGRLGLDATNVITSRGSAATQTVFHLHVHLVPRETDDGLPLPWTPQQRDR